jgi:nicotinamide-nucleotide amidase
MSDPHAERLEQAADRVNTLLREKGCRIVFAESCTAGMVCATLSRTPGISEYLCGSSVVYREGTKSAWLDVSAADLCDPAITAVSPQVAEAMAYNVLRRTPEAHLSASITGYLGPDSAADMDGVAFVGIAARTAGGEIRIQVSKKIELEDPPERHSRQHNAAAQLLETAAEVLLEI